MLYATTDGQGTITGYTSHPNPETATPTNEASAEWMDYLLSTARTAKIQAIQEVAINRIMAVVPAINSISMVDLMVELWPALNTASFGPDMVLAKDIYVYAKGNIQFAQGATQSQLDAYDPVADGGWPA